MNWTQLFSRTIRVLCLITSVFGCNFSNAASYDFCVLGQGPALTKTIHLKLIIKGQDPKGSLDLVAAELAKRVLWSGRADRAYAEEYIADLCSATSGLELMQVTLTDADVSDLSTERSAGDNETLFEAIAKRVIRSKPEDVNIKGEGLPHEVIRVFYATNRLVIGNPESSTNFGNEREPETPRIHFGAVDISIPKNHKKGELESPAIWKLEFRKKLEKHVVLLASTPLKPSEWRKEVAQRATRLGGPGVLLFIHGYNTSFDDAALRTGQLAYDLAFAGPTVFFSWPSQGQAAKYTIDEQASELSIPDMKILLSDVADLAAGAPVYVIAHSMGSRVLSHGFVELMANQLTKRGRFREIVLAAPDIDANVFREQIAPKMLEIGPRVTLYASNKDKALGLSGPVHGGARLGRLKSNGTGMTVLSGMDSIDASSIDSDFLGHSVFAQNRSVLADIADLIRNKLPPGKRPELESVENGRYWRFRP